MNQAINRLRLFFCFFSGEDDFIIRKCNNRIQIAFALIGLFVMIVFIGCWISASLFMSHIFDGARWISIPVGVIWAMLVTNLYLLLLYTISPSLLPIARKKKVVKNGKVVKVMAEIDAKEKRSLLNFSLIFRIGLMLLLATIITQPFNVMLFSPSFEESDLYAKEIRGVFENHPASWIITVFGCCIFVLPVYFKYKVRAISRKNFKEDFSSEQKFQGVLFLREQLVNTTDFDSLAKQILSIDINSVRTSDFYFQKTLLEYRIILEEYEQFKNDFSVILTEKNREYNQNTWERMMPYLNKLEKNHPEKYQAYYNKLTGDLQGEIIQRFEYWADPPFRTVHKNVTRNFSSEAELLQSFYQNND